MKVLCIYDKSGPKYHRVLLPTFLMDVEIVVNSHLVEEQLDGIDILFINRMIGGTSINRLCELREKYGFKLIIDFDDHWRLDKDHYLYKTYKDNRLSELMELFIGIADAITVTHERLADEIRRLNKNVYILPNAIPKWGQFLIKKQESDKTRLFWAGSITHIKDLELISPAINRLKNNDVSLVLGGYSRGNRDWKEMAKMFTNNSSYNTEVIEALPVDQYYAMYSKCDIGIIPLHEGRFNSFKSNLKVLETANIGSPVVVSHVHPYIGFPNYLVNYVKPQTTFYEQIKFLLNNKRLAEEQGLRLKEYCDVHYNFDKINNERKQIFEYVTGKQSEVREIPSHLQYVDQRQGIA